MCWQVHPPSTTSLSPVTLPDAADAKNASDDEFKVAEKPVAAFGDIDFIAIYDADAGKK